MATVKIRGTIKRIFETETRGNFEKRVFWLETQDQYPQTLQLEAHQNNTNLLDNYPEGCNVDVTVDIRGNVFKNKEGKEVCYNTLKMYKIELV